MRAIGGNHSRFDMLVLFVLAQLVLSTAASRCLVKVPLSTTALLTQFEMANISLVKSGGLKLSTSDRYSSWFQMLGDYKDLSLYDRLELEMSGPQQLQFAADLGVLLQPRSVSGLINNFRFYFRNSSLRDVTIWFDDIPGFERNVSTIYDLTLSEFQAPDHATVSVWLKTIRLTGKDRDSCRVLKV